MRPSAITLDHRRAMALADAGDAAMKNGLRGTAKLSTNDSSQVIRECATGALRGLIEAKR